MPALEVLETERLILRPLEVGDAVVHRRLWTERDPRVPPHRRIDSGGRPTVADIAAQIHSARDKPGPRLLTVVLRETGDVIGYCGLIPGGHGSIDEPELAYELLRATHRRGYATEAGQAVVSWATESGYRRLWAGVREWNTASRRVLEKLGFHETGQVEPDAVHGNSLLMVWQLLRTGGRQQQSTDSISPVRDLPARDAHRHSIVAEVGAAAAILTAMFGISPATLGPAER